MRKKNRTLMLTFCGLWLVTGCLSLVSMANAEPLEGGVDPARVRQIEPMLDTQPFGFGPKLEDRATWQRLAATQAYATAVKTAEKTLATPLPQMTEDIYTLYVKTGRRTREYGRLRDNRYGRITAYTHAECIENKGRFLAPLEAVLRSICQEKTWIYNFHDPKLDDYQGKQITIDLGSAALAQDLAECLYLVGDRLSPEVRRLVSAKLRERIFEPYRKAVEGTGMRQWWITADMNWNSVCHAGVVAAALAACPDRQERAFYVAAAEKYSKDFLRGFGGDGYCAEGMGYWNYGFGNYIQLCETVYQATHGGVDLYNLDGARDAALYPVRIRLINNVYPAYADCGLGSKPGVELMSYINRRYQLGLSDFVTPDFTTTGRGLLHSMMYSCSNSATALPLSPGKECYEIRSFFPHGGVLNMRPLPGSAVRMAVSIKGGNNNEPHNHNDLGSFVVVLDKEPLILDPGGEVYTARTFSKDRYKSKLLNSYGHPVPVIAGTLQRPGAAAKAVPLAKQFTDTADTYSMDLSSAYTVPSLRKLTRTFVYSRAGQGSLTVSDDFAFSSAQTFGSALLTYGQWKQLSGNELLVYKGSEAVKVTIETGGLPFEIVSDTIKEENHDKTFPTRLGINLKGPQLKGTVLFKITPTAL